MQFDIWVRKIPWRRKWQHSPVFLPGKSHGQRSLAGYSPRHHEESDMTEHRAKETLEHWQCSLSSNHEPQGFSTHFSTLRSTLALFPRCKVNQMPRGLTLMELFCTPKLVPVLGEWTGEGWPPVVTSDPSGQRSISFSRIMWDWVSRVAVTNGRCWLGYQGSLENHGLEPCVWAYEWTPTHLCSNHNATSGLASKGAQYASKFGKLSSGHRTRNGQFSSQFQRKTMQKNVQTTSRLHSFHKLTKKCSKFFKPGFNSIELRTSRWSSWI